MKKFLIIFALAFAGFTSNVNAQDPLYSNSDFEKLLKSHASIIIEMEGFGYKYSGSWIADMEISGNHALVFTQDNITHSFDISKVILIQEEGEMVRLWFAR
ncbi:MAG: hypothetical protein ACI85F_000738 [Bacteroidia bacterium]|jgi:hypothetical protein